MVDLATARYGGEVIWCNDEFFAAAANLVSPATPQWREGEFTDHGKWMDGWETRRRRDDGHDSCVIRLGLPGVVESVTVDTSHFTGNFPESFSLDACGVPTGMLDRAEWVEVIPPTALSGDSLATFAVDDPHRVTHLRLNIYPDGGIARLRVDGTPVPGMDLVCPENGTVDLAVATIGGRGVEASDAHYSSPANLVSPTEPEGMWDGWETARRRGEGHDWAVVALGLEGAIVAIDVDTRHFKGNAPGWVTVDASLGGGDWSEVCGRSPVEPDRVNRVELPARVEADRVRLNIHPDGGVARLRVMGRPRPSAAAAIRLRYLNSLFPQDAVAFFRTACASTAWVERMVRKRPFAGGDEVLAGASAGFDALGPSDWSEAFDAHPRIGESGGRQTPGGERFSAGEQSGVDERVIEELAEINRRYEERFGHTYIVRAAGRRGEELLALARRRLGNDPDVELETAAGEQREITMLRLRRMLCMTAEET